MPSRKTKQKQTEQLADASPSSIASEKRVSGKESGAGPAKGDRPAAKKQKLPMREKAEGGKQHALIDIEIPLPRKSRRSTGGEEIGDSQDEDEVSAAEGGDEGPKAEDEETEVFKTPMDKKTHIVFDDEDEDDEFVTPLEKPAIEPFGDGTVSAGRPEAEKDESEEEDEEDDDAPPEAVSTNEVAAQLKKQSQVANRAAEEQAAAKKRKRQERDALFKKQAQGRKRPAGPDAEEEKSTEARLDEQTPSFTGRGKRKAEIPDLLPPEFLESDEEDYGRAALDAPAERKPKKIKFDSSRRPRDERVGSTVYRIVSDKTDARMPPKAHKNSRSLKEQMVARKRVPQRKGGFFVTA